MKTHITLFMLILAISCFNSAQAQSDDEPFFTGLEFNQKYDTILAVPMMMTRSYSAMPSAYSLKKYCPTPRNQGRQGSCVGWSSTYAGRTILHARKKGWTNQATITSNAFSPSYTYNQIKLSSDCSQGSYISSAMNVLQKQGAPKLAEHPYACNQAISSRDKSNANPHKIKAYHRLSYDANNKNKTLNNIKKSLSNGNPVIIGMSAYASFTYAKGVWNGSQDNFRGGHAMTIIGYDDNKYGGSFEIMNSWGTTWGNGGFIWVRYNDMYKNCKEYYEMVGYASAPAPNNDKSKPVTKRKKYDLNGSFKLVKSNGRKMYATLAKNATRDFNIVKKGNNTASTYKLNSAQRSGTEFQIHISNNEPAYVYLIGYGTTSRKVSALYPFDGFSAYLGYKKNDIAIPSEDYYVALDNKKGKDYLCVLYSKKPLNIKNIARKIQNQSGSFSDKVKKVLGSQIVKGSNIEFDKNNIKFKAASNGKTIVPMILEFDHI